MRIFHFKKRKKKKKATWFFLFPVPLPPSHVRLGHAHVYVCRPLLPASGSLPLNFFLLHFLYNFLICCSSRCSVLCVDSQGYIRVQSFVFFCPLFISSASRSKWPTHNMNHHRHSSFSVLVINEPLVSISSSPHLHPIPHPSLNQIIVSLFLHKL
jgi:hypothetical protein